ncbi:MAG TPA: quercetin 2,3-dioxygenase [Nitrososphaera sp.]|nr:quercetin 2,3-dioxygenase [Nitrososphaera sp.]
MMTSQKKEIHVKQTETSAQTIPVSDTAGFVLPPSEGEKIWIVGDTLRLKATSAETGGAYTVIENISLPGSGPPPHLHENHDESMYVIDGEFEILLDAKKIRAVPGAFAYVPRGTVHRFRCIGDSPGKILIVFTPGGIEGFFREAGIPATNNGPAPSVDAAEIARTTIAGKRYGLRVINWSDGRRINQA